MQAGAPTHPWIPVCGPEWGMGGPAEAAAAMAGLIWWGETGCMGAGGATAAVGETGPPSSDGTMSEPKEM